MKDMTKIFDRMKAEMIKVDLPTETIFTVQEGLVLLAEEITMGNAEARKLFIKYGIYEVDYIKETLPMFFRLIADKVSKQEYKEQVKAGRSEDQINRQQKLEELGSNRLIGYARVSTQDQNLARQFKALEEAGVQVMFQDKASGKNVSRPDFKEMMETVKAGDTIIVSELTRLARSTTDLFNIMEEVEKKGVSVKSLKESWLDTTTAHGKLMFTIMSGMAQFERELMMERQQEGIKVAKENGVKFGVPLKEEADMDLAIQLAKEEKYTMTQIAKMCHISRTTLWRRLKDLGIRN